MKTRNGKVLIAGLSFLLVTALSLVMIFVVSAQKGAGGRTPDSPAQPESSGIFALPDPPPGFTALYYFTGAADSSPAQTIATAVHCTNLGGEAAEVWLDLADFDAMPVFTGTITIEPDYTRTFATQEIASYGIDVVLSITDPINQGFGRISSDGTGVVCTAQLIDPSNTTPQFLTTLDMIKP